LDYEQIPWTDNEEHFKAWQEGRTGYPLVDAGMRQLQETGWMHNRARMVVASFLCKDLLINWQWGEKWFMQNLLDADVAANNGGWQWSAGTALTAAPYFRIFNPVSQK
jgi:deoxyribodipyrimidine photo-lyase